MDRCPRMWRISWPRTTDLVDLDTDIDFGDNSLESPPKVKKQSAKKKKKSGAHPMAWITLLLILTGGLFYLWKQGTVSSLVRSNAMLDELWQKAGLPAPGVEKDLQEAEARAAQQAGAVSR